MCDHFTCFITFKKKKYELCNAILTKGEHLPIFQPLLYIVNQPIIVSGGEEIHDNMKK